MEALTRLDETLFFHVNNGWSSPAMDALMALVTVAGDAGVLIAFGLLGLALWGGGRRWRVMIAFIAAMTLGGVALISAKAVVDRNRPMERFKEEMMKGEVTIYAPLGRLAARSFPSGHSQAAFTAAAFFALYYRRGRAALYMAAALVAISRVYLGAHYPADIVAGGAMGWLAAWAVWRMDPEAPFRARAENTAESGV